MPGRISNSLSRAGTRVHNSLTFSLIIPAACSLPPEVTNSLERGYRIQRHIKTRTDKNDFEYLESMVERPEIKIIPKTNMISYTKNADDVILESMIMYHYQCNQEQAIEI